MWKSRSVIESVPGKKVSVTGLFYRVYFEADIVDIKLAVGLVAWGCMTLIDDDLWLIGF